MSYNTPDELKYTKDHEWTSIDREGCATIGITDFAQQSLGDIVFVELPEVNSTITKEDSFELLNQLNLLATFLHHCQEKVVEVNESLQETPELLNEDPYKN